MMLRLVTVLVLIVVMLQGATGVLYRVGDDRGWAPNVNYTEWTMNRHFYVDEWIIFNFDKHAYNVLEVNKTNYDSCNDKKFIRNITRGGRDVFQLTEARPYYFLSGGGYCWQGMKLAILVEVPPPVGAPGPVAKSGANSNGGNLLLSLILLSIGFVWNSFP